jgi:hypothetical protein
MKPTGSGDVRPAAMRGVNDMATITKVRKKLERVSALQGWRMRWYMQ